MHASNVAGLGSTNVVFNILSSLSNDEFIKNKLIKLYLPNIEFWKKKSNFNKNWEIIYVPRPKSRFLQLFIRFSEILFTPIILPKCKNLIILGDYPIRVKTNQIVLLHNPHLVSNTRGINFFTIHRFFFKLNHKFVNHCVVQTEIMQGKLINIYPFFINKVTTLLMPASKIFYNEKPINFNKSEINLFYPASFYKHKNHKLISKIINSPNFCKLNNISFHLTISIKNWSKISKFKIIEKKYLNLVGTINDLQVKEYYQKYGVLFYPSLDETLGLPLIEAMQMGIFIICSNLPYSKVICGTEAIYFDPKNVNSAIDAISELNLRLKNNNLPNWTSALAKFPKNWDEYILNFIQLLKR